MLLDWAEFVMEGQYPEWCGKTPYPWIDRARIKTALLRHHRKDLWKYLDKIYDAYCTRTAKFSLDIFDSGKMRVGRRLNRTESAARIRRTRLTREQQRVALGITAAA